MSTIWNKTKWYSLGMLNNAPAMSECTLIIVIAIIGNALLAQGYVIAGWIAIGIALVMAAVDFIGGAFS